jgi:hypothetical protein
MMLQYNQFVTEIRKQMAENRNIFSILKALSGLRIDRHRKESKAHSGKSRGLDSCREQPSDPINPTNLKNYIIKNSFSGLQPKCQTPQVPPSKPRVTLSPSTMTGTFRIPLECFNMASKCPASFTTLK